MDLETTNETIRELSQRIPELVWYGHGVRKIDHKYDALDSFRKAAQIDYNRVMERLRREDELMEIARPLLQPRR